MFGELTIRNPSNVHTVKVLYSRFSEALVIYYQLFMRVFDINVSFMNLKNIPIVRNIVNPSIHEDIKLFLTRIRLASTLIIPSHDLQLDSVALNTLSLHCITWINSALIHTLDSCFDNLSDPEGYNVLLQLCLFRRPEVTVKIPIYISLMQRSDAICYLLCSDVSLAGRP